MQSNETFITKWFGSKQLAIYCQSSEEKENDFRECYSVNRVALLMSMAQRNFQDVFKTFFCDVSDDSDDAIYSFTALINDYQHIMRTHDDDLEAITSFLISQHELECSHLAKCEYLSRNYRNRSQFTKEKESKMYKTVDNKMILLQKQLDKMHSYLLHSFDLNYRFTKRERSQISENKYEEEEEGGDDGANEEETIEKMRKVMEKKQYKLRELVGGDRMSNTKFVTNVIVDGNQHEKKETDEQNDTVSECEYSFGFPFKYYPRFKDDNWFIIKVFDDLKQEMLNNPVYSLSLEQFQSQLDSANVFLQCDHLKWMKCKHIPLTNEPQSTDTGFAEDSPITTQHIVVLLFYCNFSELCTKFSSTFRRIRNGETNEEVRARNGYFFHFSKLLLEAIHLFGTSLKQKEFGKCVYHGVNRVMVFAKMNQNILSPLSTTSQISVALQFAETGLVLTLKRSSDLEYQKYFNCVYISDYTAESERLFLGGLLQIDDILHISNGQVFGWYCRALNVLTSMLSATPLTAKIVKKKQKKWYLSMMTKARNEYPAYAQSLWEHAVQSIKEITLDLQLIKKEMVSKAGADDILRSICKVQEPDEFGFKVMDDFLLLDIDHEWIHLQRLCEIFPNLEYIEICRYKRNRGENEELVTGIRLHQALIDHLLHYQPPRPLVILLNQPDEKEISIASFMAKCKDSQKGKLQKQFVCQGGTNEQSIWICFHDSALYQACANGEEDIVSCLSDKDIKSSINQQSQYTKMTPLMVAVQQGHIKCVEYLLSNESIDISMNLNALDRSKRNAVMNSVRLCRQDIALMLLQYSDKINIDQCDDSGNSALYYAVKNNDDKIFAAIIKQKPNADLQNFYGFTALYAACMWEHYRLVEELLKYGADPNIAIVDGKTALMSAVINGRTKAIELLIEYGADLDVNNKHQTVSFLGRFRSVQAMVAMHYAIKTKNKNAAVLLLNGGADTSIINSKGQTFLHCAVDKEQVEILTALYENAKKQMDKDQLCAFVNHVDDEGQTALILSCDSYSPDDVKPCVEFLIATSLCDVNIVDKEGKSALYLAVDHDSTEIVAILLKSGAKVDCIDEKGQSLLFKTSSKQILESLYIQYLQQYGDQAAALFVNHLDKKGQTALHYACQQKEIDCAQYLIHVGAKIDVLDHVGRSVFHCAASSGRTDVIKMIYDKIEADPDFTSKKDDDAKENAVTRFINHRDNEHETALFATVVNKECAQYLLSVGGEIDPLCDIDKKGNALLKAAAKGCLQLVNVLLAADAKIDDTFDEITEGSPLHNAVDDVDDDKFEILKAIYYKYVSDKDLTKATELVNRKDWSEQTALFVALRNCEEKEINVQCVRFLLNAGAAIDIFDDDGNSPILMAAKWGQCRSLMNIYRQYLVNLQSHETNYSTVMQPAKALLNHMNNDNETALFAAVNLSGRSSWKSLEIVEFLLNEGALIKTFDKKGNSVFHKVASVNFQHTEVIKSLYKHYVTNTNEDEAYELINHGNNEGKTALMLAAHSSEGEHSIEYLHSVGAKLNVMDKITGRSALHYAVPTYYKGEKNIQMIHKLYLKDSNAAETIKFVNAQDFDGQTALHLACDENSLEGVEYLVKYALCDVNIKNNNNETAVMIAVKDGRTEIVKFLLSINAKVVDADGECGALRLAKEKKKRKECAHAIEEYLKQTLSIDKANEIIEKYPQKYSDDDDDDDNCIIC